MFVLNEELIASKWTARRACADPVRIWGTRTLICRDPTAESSRNEDLLSKTGYSHNPNGSRTLQHHMTLSGKREGFH